MIDLKKLAGIKTVADAPARLEQTQQDERAYRKSLGFLVEDAHARVDALVADARATLDGQFISAGAIPDNWRHEFGWQLATAFVLASAEFAKSSHAAVDRAAEAGHYDRTPKAEVEKKLGEYERERAALKLAVEEAEVAAAEAAAKEARAEFDRRAEALNGK